MGLSKSSNKSSISGGILIRKSGEANPQLRFRNWVEDLKVLNLVGRRNEMAVGTSPRRAPLAAHGGAEAEDEGIQDRRSMLDFETKFKM